MKKRNFFFRRRPFFRPSIARWPFFCIRWKALNVLYNFDFMEILVRGRLHIIKLTGASSSKWHRPGTHEKKLKSQKKFFLTQKIFFVPEAMKHEKNAKKCIFNFFFRRPIFRPSIAQWPIFCIRWKALNVLYNFDFMDFFVRGRLHIIKLTGAAALSFGTGTQVSR